MWGYGNAPVRADGNIDRSLIGGIVLRNLHAWKALGYSVYYIIDFPKIDRTGYDDFVNLLLLLYLPPCNINPLLQYILPRILITIPAHKDEVGTGSDAAAKNSGYGQTAVYVRVAQILVCWADPDLTFSENHNRTSSVHRPQPILDRSSFAIVRK